MDPDAFEARVVRWARAQSDVEALVQIGSRAQSASEVDAWSDWDFHLIVSDRRLYLRTDWLADIGVCWAAHVEETDRGVRKVSAMFEGGYEADFVPLTSWQMKLVYWSMARPQLRAFFPAQLLHGILNTQLVVGPGFRVLYGDSGWVRRMEALNVNWDVASSTNERLHEVISGFWRHAIWVSKKICRGESHAALRWYYYEVVERRWKLLEVEARINGRSSRPEARKAELWLSPRRLEQTQIVTSIDQSVLARALLAEIALFEEVARSVSDSRGISLPDYSAVAGWIRAQLAPLAERG